MRKQTATSLEAFQAEAKRIRESREHNPDSVTVVEFAAMSGLSRPHANVTLAKMLESGRVVKCKKRVGNRLIPSYRMK